MDRTTNERTAILVDGAFYRKRAFYLFGDKSPQDRAHELIAYCKRHLEYRGGKKSLYRIFYYDCLPIEKTVHHPLTGKTFDTRKLPVYRWANEFYEELANKRKVALRFGELQERESGYKLNSQIAKRLFRGDIHIEDLTEGDFSIDVVQKGVDMRIGLDIASMAHKGLVTQIVLIAGDSDFVPAAKYARREGIDFVLDPMRQSIRPSLNRHIDGLRTCTPKNPTPENEELCIKEPQTNMP